MQVFFPDMDGEDSWDTINSFQSPFEAIQGCSECVESVKMLLEVPFTADVISQFFRIRVWDAENEKLVIWEDETGTLFHDEAVFQTL